MRIWLTLAALIALSPSAMADVRIEVASHIGASVDEDPMAGGISLVNKGDPVELRRMAVNDRPKCVLDFYEPHTVQTNLLYGIHGIFALTPAEADQASLVEKANGKELDPGPIRFETGDVIVVTAFSMLPSAALLGIPDAGECGNVLVKLTIETDQGDFSWEW